MRSGLPRVTWAGLDPRPGCLLPSDLSSWKLQSGLWGLAVFFRCLTLLRILVCSADQPAQLGCVVMMDFSGSRALPVSPAPHLLPPGLTEVLGEA